MTTTRLAPLLAAATVTLATACSTPCNNADDCASAEICVVEPNQDDGYCDGFDNAEPGSNQTNPGTPPPSNRARFVFNCDLQGANGALTVDIEAINQAAAIWGSGPNPQITSVVSAGSVLYVTAGELRSATGYYVFTGENQFADFTDMRTYDRFRVQWVFEGGGLTMIINPFGQGPARHRCTLSSSTYR